MLYGCVLLIRPDVSTKHVGLIGQEVREIIERGGGRIEGSEYWGFRTLAYRIDKRGKAHYLYLGIDTESLDGFNEYLKFHKDIFRCMCKKAPKGLKFPTMLFQAPLTDLETFEVKEEPQETIGVAL